LVYGRREELLQEIRPATLAIAILAIPSGGANLESYSPFAEPSQPVEALVSLGERRRQTASLGHVYLAQSYAARKWRLNLAALDAFPIAKPAEYVHMNI
jgi:hypothetical protein